MVHTSHRRTKKVHFKIKNTTASYFKSPVFGKFQAIILPILLALLSLFELSQLLRRATMHLLRYLRYFNQELLCSLGTKNQRNIGKFITWNFLMQWNEHEITSQSPTCTQKKEHTTFLAQLGWSHLLQWLRILLNPHSLWIVS